ncbi:MAG TPA: nuclear transport factor 2 family protein [Verrucomicrobiae bacterium]|nr:nuclear transport factor 2 family protein [Verrucomicrobiae bacterium]
MSLSTEEVLSQFNDAFQKHDPSGLEAIIADNCILENTGPAPDGAKYEGKDACVAFWTNIAANRDMRFKLEATDILGDRGIILWRLYWGASDADSVRGVNIMRVHEGKIVEGLGYVKA